MTYNMSYIFAANNTVEMMTGVNSSSDGWFFGILMVILYVGVLLVFQNSNLKKAFLADSFIMAFIGWLLFAQGFISDRVLLIPILLTFIGLIAYLMTGE